jgi:hypothetical protein
LVSHDLGHNFVLFWIVAYHIVNLLCRGDKVDLVDLSDDLSSKLGFVVFLLNVVGLIVKKAMRVSHPSDTAKKHTASYKHLLTSTLRGPS